MIKLPVPAAAILMITSIAVVAQEPPPVPELRPGILQGYLELSEYPDSLRLLPPPPAPESLASTLDEKVSQQALTLHETPRFAMAREDNNLRFPEAAGTFSCAVGAPISEAQTPYLYRLLRRSLTDAGLATYAAKTHYQRKRPFVVNGEPNCAKQSEQELLANDGSYPSGHTAVGWAWALILTELAPDRSNEILARGRDYGQSRVVCNVHWPSDVVAGRMIGAAAVAMMHAKPGFLHDLKMAKAELAEVRGQTLPPSRDCEAESLAISAP
ncbi:MAG: phosphatase PAP2 family protein [Pseudomonadales bacterium]